MFLLVLVVDVLGSVLKVTEHLGQGQGTHLVVEPLVVEEDVVVEILVAETADQLEGELGELAQVVPGQLALLAVVGEGHGGHLAVLALEVEGVPLDLV